MAKPKRYTPGLQDIEMTLEAIKKRKARERRKEYLKEKEEEKSTEKGGELDEGNGKS